MTIRMLQPWDIYQAQKTYTLGSTEETRLVSLGYATFDLDGDPGPVPLVVDTASGALLADDKVVNLGAMTSPQPASDLRVTVVGGRVFQGGKPLRHIGVNAWDQVYDALKGGTYYQSDLAAIAGYGVKVIRVSSTPNVAADIVTYIGTNAAAPVSTYKPKLEAVLNEAYRRGVGVMLGVIWDEAQLLTALGQTQPDLANSASTVRVWLREWATWLARNFYDHPGLAGWFVANEFVNYAWGDKFITATSDATKNHIGAMVAVTNDIVDSIRAYDGIRVIMSAGGSLGNGSMGPFKGFAEKYIASAGKCDAVSYHFYPDSWTSASASHAFVGDDCGGSEILLSSLRNACAAAGKALIVDECGADYDSPPNTIAKVQYQKATDAGIDLLMDWGWYTNNATTPDLKSLRVACMDEIKTRNISLAALGHATLAPVSPSPRPSYSLVGRTSSSANGWFRVAQSAAYQPTAGQAYAVMFRMREPTLAMIAGRRILACNDANGGFIVSSTDFEASGVADHVQFQIMFGGTLKGLTAQQNKRRPGEWNHYAFAWDGLASGASVFASWFNGLPARGNTVTNPGSPATSANALHVGAAADGLNGNAIDVADLVIVKRAGGILKSQEVMDYFSRGVLPAGTVLHVPLNGTAADVIGGNAVTAGAASSYIVP